MDSAEDIKKRRQSMNNTFGNTSGPAPIDKVYSYFGGLLGDKNEDKSAELLKKKLKDARQKSDY